MTNPICARCIHGMNRLNGRWCTYLDVLVQYSKRPPCHTQTTKPSPQ